MSRAEFRKVGDWARIHSLVGSLSLEFSKARTESLKDFGKEMEKTVTGHIEAQDLLWTPLTGSYKAYKARKGYSDLTYVRTGSYFKSIRSYMRSGSIYVGFLPAARTPEGKSLVKIAKVLEFGSKINNTPARPLWRPSFNEVFSKFKVDNKPVKILLDNLKRKFGGMTYGDLDRLLFETLRVALVVNGVLPDIAQHPTDASWTAARNQMTSILKPQGLEIFDIYNVGSGDDRGTIKNSRFTIGRGAQERGSLAVGPFPYRVPTEGSFRELEHLDFAKDITYEIRCISNSVHEEKYMMNILDSVFGQRRFFHAINEQYLPMDDIVLVEWNGASDIAVVGNQREYMYEYILRDVWVGTERILREGVPQLNTVDFYIATGNEVPLLPNKTINYNELPSS